MRDFNFTWVGQEFESELSSLLLSSCLVEYMWFLIHGGVQGEKVIVALVRDWSTEKGLHKLCSVLEGMHRKFD